MNGCTKKRSYGDETELDDAAVPNEQELDDVVMQNDQDLDDVVKMRQSLIL